MSVSIANESFLLTQFREFYTEVINLKQLIENSGGMSRVEAAPTEETLAPSGNGNVTAKLPPLETVALRTLSGSENITSLAIRGAVDSTGQLDQTKLTRLVWQNLITLFRRNAVQIMRAAGNPTDNYFEAQYVMAAFADEIFIHLDWEGKRAWTSNLLETALFQTHVAGETFFDKLDQLLRERDPAQKSLAAIYLSALSLGFRGKYHGLNDHGKLRRYRQELFAFVFRQPPDLINESRVAFPDSYVQNLKKEKRKKLTNPRVWLLVFGLMLVSYVAASHGVWLSLTSRLESVNKRIVEIESRLDQNQPPAN
jgi:type VI secretion system protein ImpK